MDRLQRPNFLNTPKIIPAQNWSVQQVLGRKRMHRYPSNIVEIKKYLTVVRKSSGRYIGLSRDMEYLMVAGMCPTCSGL